MKLKYVVALLFAAVAMGLSAQGYKDGVEFYKAQRFNQARTLLERNLNKPGTDKAASYYYLGMIELQIENPNLDNAEKDFQAGIEANPKYAYNYIGQGLVNLYRNDSKAAEAQFKLAEKMAGKDISSVEVAIARAYYSTDANLYAKEIKKRMEKAYKKNAENPDYYIFLADQATDARKWGEANQNFELAYGYSPMSSEAYVRYSDILKVRNPKESIRVLKVLLENNPQSALGQRELARTYYDNNMYKDAVVQYGKYVNNPNHFDEDEAEYAFLLFYSQDYQKGYDYATKLLSINPDNYSAMRFQLMNAAQIPALADKMPEMAKKLWNAHEQDPVMRPFAPIDYNIVADQFSKAQEYDKAEQVLTEATKQFPNDPRFLQARAFMYLDQEKTQDAAEAYNEYMAKVANPSAADLRTAMILNYAMASQLKDTDAAGAQKFASALNGFLVTAQEIYPEEPSTYFFMGREKILNASAANAGSVAVADFTKGIAAFEQIPADRNRAYINNAVTMYNYLAQAAAKAGNTQQARDYYQKVLAISPSDATATAGLNALK